MLDTLASISTLQKILEVHACITCLLVDDCSNFELVLKVRIISVVLCTGCFWQLWVLQMIVGDN
jgi:hypothetical protein